MKMFRKVLSVCLVLCLCIVFGAIIFRIYIAEHYPANTVNMVFTEPLEAYYKENPESFAAYTQSIRFPYDDNDDGNFFASGLIVVPNADHLQVTVRYNESSLAKVAAFYGLSETPAPAEGLFRYTLTVSYNETAEGTDFRTYESSYLAEDAAYMYRYGKLAFDGVEFDGAVWMRVDIYYGDETEAFGSIAVYEAKTYDDDFDTFVDMPLKNYSIDKEDLPK